MKNLQVLPLCRARYMTLIYIYTRVAAVRVVHLHLEHGRSEKYELPLQNEGIKNVTLKVKPFHPEILGLRRTQKFSFLVHVYLYSYILGGTLGYNH